MEVYRLTKVNLKDAIVRNPYFVFKLDYVNAKGVPRYKLKKQFSSEDAAREYIATLTSDITDNK